MKYESCTGMCYAWSDVVRIHDFGLNMKSASEFLHRLVKAHDQLCGNDQLAYALDVDEETETFVASFQRYGALDLFVGKTPLEAMNKLIDAALSYYESDEYRDNVAAKPGLGHDVCEHGEDKKLLDFAISFSGLNEQDQDILRKEVGI